METVQENNLEMSGISSTTITIGTPLVSYEDKFYFLKNYITPYIIPFYDGKHGVMKFDVSIPEANSLEDKILLRLGYYLKTGKISLGHIRLSPEEKSIAFKKLQDMIISLNMKFNLYVRANNQIVKKINDTLKFGQEELDKLYKQFELQSEFNSNSNGDLPKLPNSKPILKYKTVIDNGNPQWDIRKWQTDFINACRTRFLWCNAFGTGLGKTSTALLAVQDRQNFHPNERAIFTVPASSLNKWFKEAFLGSFKNGVQIKPSVLTSNIEEKTLFINLMPSSEYKKLCKMSEDTVLDMYPNDIFIQHIHKNQERFSYLKNTIDEQLALILLKDENNQFVYDKVFMSHEHFYRIRLKEDTVKSYMDYYSLVDEGFQSLEINNQKRLFKVQEQMMKTLHAESGGKNKANLFLEDMDFSILVADEAHAFKNNHEIYDTGTGESFGTVRFFPNAPSSSRGIDMVAKAHYLRSKSPTYEGTLALTATPITNSPLETYGIMSLILGEYFINKSVGVKSLSEFLNLFCIVEPMEGQSVDDETLVAPTFQGLNNLKLLQKLLQKVVYFVDEHDDRVQGEIKLPIRNKQNVIVPMLEHNRKEINLLKSVYQTSKSIQKEISTMDFLTSEELQQVTKGMFDVATSEYKDTLKRFDEDIEINSSTFNLMTKFERIILDEDLLENSLVLEFPIEMKNVLEETITKFNSKGFSYTKFRKNPQTDSNALLKTTKKIKTNDKGEEKETFLYQYAIKAYLYEDMNEYSHTKRVLTYWQSNKEFHHNLLGDSDLNSYQNLNSNPNPKKSSQNNLFVVIDSMSYGEHNEFFKILCEVIKKDVVFCSTEFFTNAVLNMQNRLGNWISNHASNISINEENLLTNTVSSLIGFNISPKIYTFLEKFKYEIDNPRGKNHDGEPTSLVKQLVFCDELGAHFKLIHLMSRVSHIPLQKIQPLTGKENGENDEILALQDNFNAEDGENEYQVVLANAKGEYAIDLQNGTQAIHLLTVRWTPDSETQRVGRGARQGNQTDEIVIYDYLMSNTFDDYKRRIINSKEKWINQLFNGKIDYIRIIQHISKEQQEKMLMLMGDSDPEQLKEFEKQIELENEKRECERIEREQSILLSFILNNPYTGSQDFTQAFQKYINFCISTFIEIQKERALLIQNLIAKINNQMIILKRNCKRGEYKFSSGETFGGFGYENNDKHNYVGLSLLLSTLGTTLYPLNRKQIHQKIREWYDQYPIDFENATITIGDINKLLLLNQRVDLLIDNVLQYCNYQDNGFLSNTKPLSLGNSISKIKITPYLSFDNMVQLLEQINNFSNCLNNKYYFLNQWLLMLAMERFYELDDVMEKEMMKIVIHDDYQSSNHALLFPFIDNQNLKAEFEGIYNTAQNLSSQAVKSYQDLCANEPNRISYSPNLVSSLNGNIEQGFKVSNVNGQFLCPNSLVFGYYGKEVNFNTKYVINELQDILKQDTHTIDVDSLLDTNVFETEFKVSKSLIMYFKKLNKVEYRQWAYRGLQILQWFNKHKINLYCIADYNQTFDKYYNDLINKARWQMGDSSSVFGSWLYGNDTFSRNVILDWSSFNSHIHNHWEFTFNHSVRHHKSSDAGFNMVKIEQPNLPSSVSNYDVLREAMGWFELLYLLYIGNDKQLGKYFKTYKEKFHWEFNHEYANNTVKKHALEVIDCINNNTLLVPKVEPKPTSLVSNSSVSNEIGNEGISKDELKQHPDFLTWANPIVADLLKQHKNGDVFAFQHPNSYELNNEVEFRKTLNANNLFHECFFYYGNNSPKDTQHNPTNEKAHKKLKINLNRDVKPTGVSKVWIMGYQGVKVIIDRIIKIFSVKKASDILKDLRLTHIPIGNDTNEKNTKNGLINKKQKALTNDLFSQVNETSSINTQKESTGFKSGSFDISDDVDIQAVLELGREIEMNNTENYLNFNKKFSEINKDIADFFDDMLF